MRLDRLDRLLLVQICFAAFHTGSTQNAERCGSRGTLRKDNIDLRVRVRVRVRVPVRGSSATAVRAVCNAVLSGQKVLSGRSFRASS